jgi:hypothetical protein
MYFEVLLYFIIKELILKTTAQALLAVYNPTQYFSLIASPCLLMKGKCYRPNAQADYKKLQKGNRVCVYPLPALQLDDVAPWSQAFYNFSSALPSGSTLPG